MGPITGAMAGELLMLDDSEKGVVVELANNSQPHATGAPIHRLVLR